MHGPCLPSACPPRKAAGRAGSWARGSWSLIKCLIVNHVHQYLGWARGRGPSASGALAPFPKGKNHIGRFQLRPSVLRVTDAPWDPHCLPCSSPAHRSRLLFLELPTSARNRPPDARADWRGPETPGCPFMAAAPPCQTQDHPQGQTKACRPGQVARGHWRSRPVDPGDSPCLGFMASLQPPLLSLLEAGVSLEASVSWPSPGSQWASDVPVHPGQASPSHRRRTSALDSSPQEN